MRKVTYLQECTNLSRSQIPTRLDANNRQRPSPPRHLPGVAAGSPTALNRGRTSFLFCGRRAPLDGSWAPSDRPLQAASGAVHLLDSRPIVHPRRLLRHKPTSNELSRPAHARLCREAYAFITLRARGASGMASVCAAAVAAAREGLERYSSASDSARFASSDRADLST